MSQHPDQLADQLIDRVLIGLRDITPPEGLEARIAGRLSAVEQTNSPCNPAFALFLAWPRYTMAVAMMAVLAAFLLASHLNHPPQQTGTLNSNTTTKPVILSEVVRGTLRTTQPKDPDALTPTITSRNLSGRNYAPPDQLTDPDQIALAETLAPSHPAPAMPLTPQEQLLANATSPGQPIEIAELELAREPFMEAASKARERSSFEQFVRRVLSPLVLAESFDPTPTARPVDFTEPVPTNHKPSSSTN